MAGRVRSGRKGRGKFSVFFGKLFWETFDFFLFPTQRAAWIPVFRRGCRCLYLCITSSTHTLQPVQHTLIPASYITYMPTSLHPCLVPVCWQTGGMKCGSCCQKWFSCTIFCMRRIFSPWAVLLGLLSANRDGLQPAAAKADFSAVSS